MKKKLMQQQVYVELSSFLTATFSEEKRAATFKGNRNTDYNIQYILCAGQS